jgi:hypothetical protein
VTAQTTALTHVPVAADLRWTRLWIGWIGLFFALELPPLFRGRPQDTLSDHVWAWFGIPHHPAPERSVRVRRLALLTFLAWLCSHFLTGDQV